MRARIQGRWGKESRLLAPAVPLYIFSSRFTPMKRRTTTGLHHASSLAATKSLDVPVLVSSVFADRATGKLLQVASFQASLPPTKLRSSRLHV